MELETLLENQQQTPPDPHLETPPRPQETVHRLSDAIKLQTQNLELSERLVELQTQCEYAASREKSLIKLVEHLRENQPKLEIEISEGIKQYQQQVEEKYVQDIKDLSETYEAEKRSLVLELEQLAESCRKVGFDGSRSNWGNSFPVESRDQSTQLHCETADQSTQTERLNPPSPQVLSPRSMTSESEDNFPLSSANFHRTGSLGLNSPTDLSTQELSNLLDIETMRSQKANDQIKELEKILEAQRVAFRKHIERERDMTIAALDVPTSDSEVEPQEKSTPSFRDSLGDLKRVLLSLTPATPPDELMSAIQCSLRLLKFLEEKEKIERESPAEDHSSEQSDLETPPPPIESLIPDWYLDVLRKLRQRVSDLETALPKKFFVDDRCDERAALNEEQLSEIKLRYEEALLNVQSALEEQTQLAKDQIERLEEIVRNAKAVDPPPSHQGNQLQLEVSRLRHALAGCKEKSLSQEKVHAEELQEVWAHFQKYRAAQDLLTSSLENEIRSRDDSGKWLRGNSEEESFEYQELSTLCEIKRASLQAVLNALALLDANLATEGKQDYSSEPHSLREELLEARLNSAEREVGAIRDSAVILTISLPLLPCRS
jgi:hypothetical protein